MISLKRFFQYSKLAVNEFLEDNGTHLSASVSYYVLFSLFPLLLALLSILSFIYASPERAIGLKEVIIDWFGRFMPNILLEYFKVNPEADEYITNLAKQNTTGIIVAIIALLWAGISMFNVVRKTLNIIWGITIPRPFFRERLMEIIMMAVVGFVILASLWLSIIIGLGSSDSILYHTVLPGTIMFLIFIFLYRFVPYVKLKWKDVWFEALLAAIAFEVVKYYFIRVINNTSTAFIYGTLSLFIAFLLWAYTSSVVFLFCAEMASLRFRGATFWGKGPIQLQEGPLVRPTRSRRDIQKIRIGLRKSYRRVFPKKTRNPDQDDSADYN
ncbi:MAG: YihY/virulence factor BrkB family protein [Chloroflexi bacterium]|nr:YihY/virulence factor BrkB family protein [Chloroflexota bacterium]